MLLNEVLTPESKVEEDSFDIKVLKSLRSFAARIDYVKSKLKKIGAGTSRIVYDAGDNRVLKLAKNRKGIAQNDFESDGYISGSELTPELFDSDIDNLWIIVEKADRITNSEFEKLSGMSFDIFQRAIEYESRRITGKSITAVKPLSKEEMKQIYEKEFFTEVVDLVFSADIAVGDLLRLSSWGKINNRLVLVDSGASNSIIKQHYNKHIR